MQIHLPTIICEGYLLDPDKVMMVARGGFEPPVCGFLTSDMSPPG